MRTMVDEGASRSASTSHIRSEHGQPGESRAALGCGGAGSTTSLNA